jgi:chemotaxis methyl-accepting protein methylase
VVDFMMMEMDKKTFNAFRTFIYNESGFALGNGKEAFVAARASKRMKALECGCYNE